MTENHKKLQQAAYKTFKETIEHIFEHLENGMFDTAKNL